ncbi:MAG: rhomboid family intramembrane serine protease [Armatimonadota bacterium]|nr:rhomboid family intramembrane serine protease [Armatimonadota bacterium]
MDNFVDYLRRGYIPVTKALVLITVVMFIFALATANTATFDTARSLIAFESPQLIARPWTVVTYPLMTLCGPICILFYGLMLWWFGGSLERAWGSRVYAYFFFIISAISALSVWIGSLATGLPVGLLGLGLPLSAVTVAWATLNPEATILLYFVLPVKAKYVGWATVASVAVYFAYSYPSPRNLVLTVFGIGGCAAAWRYVHLRWAGTTVRTPVIRLHRSRMRRLNPLFWIKDYRERKRLRKLFGEDREDRGGWR